MNHNVKVTGEVTGVPQTFQSAIFNQQVFSSDQLLHCESETLPSG